MRKSFLFIASLWAASILLGVAAVSCSEKKSETVPTDSIAVRTDSTADTDTLDQLIAETPMPKSADELFDDFFFNFSANKKLQKSRIQFPLPVVKSNDTTMLTEKQWKMEHFFMRQDFYTLVFDNRRQMNVVKDTTIGHVVVEKIYLNKKYVKQYVFDRTRGQWMMTSIVYQSLKNNQNASFLQFYHQFVTDSTFQVSSINDPLEFTGPDPDNDFGTMDGILAPEQWDSFAPELPSDMIYNILYGQTYTASNQKIFVIRGIANGLETELTFKRKNKQWKLYKLIM